MRIDPFVDSSSTLASAGLEESSADVLVYGAAGSIGTAAVQLLAHHFEAEVTAVCDTKDVELVATSHATPGSASRATSRASVAAA